MKYYYDKNYEAKKVSLLMKPKDFRYYDAFDVARVLRIHFKTALKWGKEGKIPSFKISNRRYFPPDEILALKRELGK